MTVTLGPVMISYNKIGFGFVLIAETIATPLFSHVLGVTAIDCMIIAALTILMLHVRIKKIKMKCF